MIVVDLELSGLDFVKAGVWQIGAVDLSNPKNTFLQESRIDKEDEIENEALLVTGKTEEELRDKKKQSQEQLIKNFFDWMSKTPDKILVTHNALDYSFLLTKSRKYNLKIPFQHRTFDLHAIAAMKYFEIHKKFLIEDGKSQMSLPKVMEFCGMKDQRMQLVGGVISQEGSPHNALEDAKLEAECFNRIVYGKSLFKEFSHFPVPKYL